MNASKAKGQWTYGLFPGRGRFEVVCEGTYAGAMSFGHSDHREGAAPLPEAGVAEPVAVDVEPPEGAVVVELSLVGAFAGACGPAKGVLFVAGAPAGSIAGESASRTGSSAGAGP